MFQLLCCTMACNRIHEVLQIFVVLLHDACQTTYLNKDHHEMKLTNVSLTLQYVFHCIESLFYHLFHLNMVEAFCTNVSFDPVQSHHDFTNQYIHDVVHGSIII